MKLINITYHKILGRNFVEIFCGVLNENTKAVANTIIDRDFMSLWYDLAEKILHRISKGSMLKK